MNALLDRIERFIIAMGKAASLLILLIMAGVAYEVVARYAFNAPTNWSWLINRQLFGAFVIFAGSYTLIKGSHIRIEIIYEYFPPFLKGLVRWLSFFAALVFLGSLLWKSSAMGVDSWQARETATGVFKLPLYPLKLFIPVGTAVFIVACIVVFIGKKD